MADQRDDLDAWLATQVKPLPPPPGTFELIRRRARRRKMTRAVAAAAGAAAVIVVIATVPRLVISQLSPGPGPLPSGAQAGQTSSAGAHRRHHTAPPSAPAVPSTALPATPVSPAAPPRFAATSVTFVSQRTGYVIGQAGTPGQCTGPDPHICTSLATTTDAGRTWHGVPAPVTGAPAGPAGVSQVRFFDTSDGWAFGPQLWATHDGGQSWQQIHTAGMRVLALEAAGRRVFAVWARCTGRGAGFAAGCTSAALYSAAPGSDRWTPVAGTGTSFSMTGPASSAALVLTSRRGYLLPPDGVLLSGPATSPGSWQPVTGSAAPCQPGAPQAFGSSGQPSAALLATTTAPAGGPGLVLVCAGQVAGGSQRKTVYTSADGGRTWQQPGRAPAAGAATSVAGSPAGTIVLATSQGLEVSTDGGATWTAGRGALPLGGFSYVGMTEATQGVAVPADPDAHAVWFTYDGGATWQKSPIP